eukprot:788961-Amphidinium_carterae.1
MVAVVEWAAKSFKLDLTDRVGRNNFGGHSWRVSGARFFASLVFELLAIKSLGRWGSATVERY